MKKILIVVLVLTFCSMASAQGFKLGVAGQAVFPVGDFADVTKSTGWGVDAFGVFDVMLLTITARVGYIDFGEKSYDAGAGVTYTSHWTAVPVLAGLRWDFGLPVGPSLYAGVEAGIHAFSVTSSVSGFDADVPTESETKFSISPNVGVVLAGFDISAYYMYIKDASYWGVRLGWGLGLGV
jgi:hypothetical protein